MKFVSAKKVLAGMLLALSALAVGAVAGCTPKPGPACKVRVTRITNTSSTKRTVTVIVTHRAGLTGKFSYGAGNGPNVTEIPRGGRVKAITIRRGYPATIQAFAYQVKTNRMGICLVDIRS